ncbi:hypothetical protein HYY75_09200 [bacterium]|nr:hypothetical protein [bacterium]
MKRYLWVSAMIVALACVLAQIGCWKSGSNPTAALIHSEAPPTRGVAPSLKFKMVLPESPRRGPSTSLRTGSPNAIIMASEAASPTVTFKLTLINVGNATNPTTVLSKTVLVSSGTAYANFQDLPALSTLGDIHIENGNYGGYSDFRGATDLLPEIENILEVSPKNSKTKPDIIAEVVEKVVSSQHLFPKVGSDLTSRIITTLTEMDLTTDAIYEEALTQFVNNHLLQQTISLETNSVVLDSSSSLALSSLSVLSETTNEMVFSNTATQRLPTEI